MLKNRIALAALATASLLAAAPAFADGDRYGRPAGRTVIVQQHAPYQSRGWEQARRPVIVHRPVVVERRPVIVHRPVVVQQPPVVVYRDHSHGVLGGLIIGTVLGAVIASNAGY